MWFGHNIKYRLLGTFYVLFAFGDSGLFAKTCFLLSVRMQFCKAVDFSLALLYTNFKLQSLMNYSPDFKFFADSDC